MDKPVTDDFIKKMSSGVPILGTVTRKCQVEKTGKKTFRIILTQGLNRRSGGCVNIWDIEWNGLCGFVL